MNLKLTHTEGDVEFVRVEDVEIGADLDQRAYWLALKMPEGWVDYIRAVRSVERMPDAPFHYFHTPNAGVWTDDLVAAKAPTPPWFVGDMAETVNSETGTRRWMILSFLNGGRWAMVVQPEQVESMTGGIVHIVEVRTLLRP